MDRSTPYHRYEARRFFVAAVAVGLAFSVAGCGTSKSDADANTFSVDGMVIGNANESLADGKCVFPDASFEPGESIVLRGADNTIMATDQLKPESDHYVGKMASCGLNFHFDKVKAGEAGYQLMIGSSGPIIATETQLRQKHFEIIPRSALDVMAGHPAFKVESWD